MRVSDSLIRLVLEMNEENSENETKKYKGGYALRLRRPR